MRMEMRRETPVQSSSVKTAMATVSPTLWIDALRSLILSSWMEMEMGWVISVTTASMLPTQISLMGMRMRKVMPVRLQLPLQIEMRIS